MGVVSEGRMIFSVQLSKQCFIMPIDWPSQRPRTDPLQNLSVYLPNVAETANVEQDLESPCCRIIYNNI